MRSHRLTLRFVILGSLAFASTTCTRRTTTASPPLTTQSRAAFDTTPSARRAAPRATASTAPLPSSIAYTDYHHPRAGFAIRYPSFLTAGPSPHWNNGISFRDGDRVGLNVSGSLDLYPDQTNAEQLRMAVDRHGTDGATQLTEQRTLADGYIASGSVGARLFYERRVRTGGRVVTMLFDYDASLRDSMRPVVDEVVRSVRVDARRAGAD